MESFDDIPAILNEPIFHKAFQEAGLAGLTQEEREMYEQSLMQYRDIFSVVETAVEDNKSEIAKNLIALGSDNAFIMKATGLVSAQIEKLRSSLKMNK